MAQKIGEWLKVFCCAWVQKTGDEGGKDIMKKHRRQVLYSGIITAIGMNNLIDMVHSPHRLWCELFQNWLHIICGTKTVVS